MRPDIEKCDNIELLRNECRRLEGVIQAQPKETHEIEDLRDRFAGQVLQIIIGDGYASYPNERLAAEAYLMADAMLKAREVKS